jgi:hypothetical protein
MEERLKEDVYLILMTVVILLTVTLREVTESTELMMGTMETTHPCPSLLNFHRDTTFGGTQWMHKSFSMPPKRKRQQLTE